MINCNLKQNANLDICKKKVGEAHFTMILPKADNSGNKIKPSRYGKYVKKINRRFGGSTTKPITLGCWKDEERDKLVCEQGLAIETWRDFDSNPELKKLDSIERKKRMNQDFKFMNKLAEQSAKEFGQDSVPIIFDNIKDVKLNKGEWRKKLIDSKLTGKKVNPDTLWNENI